MELNREELQNKLKEKLKKEFEAFKTAMLQKSKAEIFELSYVTFCKETIATIFDTGELSSEQIQGLLEQEDSLEYITMLWLAYDGTEDSKVILEYLYAKIKE